MKKFDEWTDEVFDCSIPSFNELTPHLFFAPIIGMLLALALYIGVFYLA